MRKIVTAIASFLGIFMLFGCGIAMRFTKSPFPVIELNFDSISVDGTLTADGSLTEKGTLSASGQDIFVITNRISGKFDEGRMTLLSNNMLSEEEPESENESLLSLTFSWDGMIFVPIESPTKPSRTGADWDGLSHRLTEFDYSWYPYWGKEIDPVDPTEHTLGVNYLFWIFTDVTGKRTLFQMGQPDRDIYDFGLFSIPAQDEQGRVKFLPSILNSSSYNPEKDDYTVSIGAYVKDISQYTKIEIGAIQVTGVKEGWNYGNDQVPGYKATDGFVISFSRFNGEESLQQKSLSPTIDGYIWSSLQFIIDENDHLNFLYFRPLNSPYYQSGFEYQEIYFIYLDDNPSFSSMNVIMWDDLEIDNYLNQHSPHSDDVPSLVDKRKLAAVFSIDYDPIDFSKSMIDVYYRGQKKTILLDEFRFLDLNFIDLGIVVKDTEFFSVGKIKASTEGNTIDDFNVSGSAFVTSSLAGSWEERVQGLEFDGTGWDGSLRKYQNGNPPLIITFDEDNNTISILPRN